MKVALVKVPENREAEFLELFYNTSAFTFEGLDITDKSGMKELEKILRETGYKEKNFLAYHFSGSVMNKHYGLTGDNAYPDNLTFVVIPEYYNPLVKLQIGARWFDDIVSNNCIRENAQRCDQNPDYL